MELLDIVDKNGNYTGETVERKQAQELGLLHWEVIIIIVNEKEQILLQKRSTNKKHFPNKWALCSGLVISGESCEEAAVRELKEELGVEFQIDDLHLLEKNLNLTRFYYVITNYDESQFVIQKEELSSVKWFDLDEILEKVSCGDDSIIIRKDRLYLFNKIRKIQ